MEEEKKPIQVNTDFTNTPELLVQLDEMRVEDFTDRSKFIRKLIAQEWARRNQLPLPEPKKSVKRHAAVAA